MENAPDCTLLRTLEGFVAKFMPRHRGYAAAFKAHFPEATIETISQRMAEIVRKEQKEMRNDDTENEDDEGMDESVSRVAEKEITRLWVCSRCMRFTSPLTRLTSRITE